MSEHDISLPELLPFGQGYKDMGPAVDEFERRLLGVARNPELINLDPEDWEQVTDQALEEVETLRHDGNPVLTWCAGNAVTSEDPAGNRKPDKGKATARIDGIVASVMATGISASTDIGGGKSIYDEGVGI